MEFQRHSKTGKYVFIFKDEKELGTFLDRLMQALHEANRSVKLESYAEKIRNVMDHVRKEKGRQKTDIKIFFSEEDFCELMPTIFFMLFTSTQQVNMDHMYKSYLLASIREKNLSELVSEYISEVKISGNYEDGFKTFEENVRMLSDPEELQDH